MKTNECHDPSTQPNHRIDKRARCPGDGRAKQIGVYMQYAESYQVCSPPDNAHRYYEPTPKEVKTKAAAIRDDWRKDDTKLCELAQDAIYGVPDAELAGAIRDMDDAELGRLVRASINRELFDKSQDAAYEVLHERGP